MSTELKDDIEQLAKTQTRTEHIYQQPPGWIVAYPQFSKLADEQMHSFWPHDEPNVEADLQDLKTKATPSELHGIMSVLKLFTHYEMRAGDDYWAGRIMSTFKRPEIQRMASMFSAVEFNSHAPFYNKINEVLFVDTPEFYSEWINDPILVARMNFINDIIDAEDDLVSIGGFSFIEGAVLYGSFGWLKHFQSQTCGVDMIRGINRGINLSCGDENTHAVGGALLFNEVKKQRNLSKVDQALLTKIITKLAQAVYDHEEHIIDLIFEMGPMKGITSKNMKDFIKHRVNLCLANLGMPPLFDAAELDGYVASWFYNDINSVQFHDFFTGSGSEYHLNWSEHRFGQVWSKA